MTAVYPIQFPEIEDRLFRFVHIARSAKLPLSIATLQAKAHNIRDNLVNVVKDEQKRKKISSFQASRNWVLGCTKRHSIQSVRLHGEAGSVPVNVVSFGIARLRGQLQDYDANCIFNMDETGLFFKLFPKRTYVLPGENRKNLRGTKDMKTKSRVSVYVCSDATGLHKVPLASIGTAQIPRCFRKGPPAKPYFSQRNGWSDSVTYRRCFGEVFLPVVRRHTSKKVALIMDNCGPHATDVLDVNGQASILTLPPNCTSLFQPIDMGVIATLKAKYKSRLLKKILHAIEERENLRNAAKGMKAGMKGLDEGHDPHMLDVTELLKDAWDDVTLRTVARCWGKANILPRGLQADLDNEHGKNTLHGRRALDEDVRKLCTVILELKVSAPHQSDIAQQLLSVGVQDMELVANWVAVEEDSEVLQVMADDCMEDVGAEGGCTGEEKDSSNGEESGEGSESGGGGATVTSMGDVVRAFAQAQRYCEEVRVTEASYHLRLAERALSRVYNEHTKRQRRQTLVTEHFVAP